MSLRIRFFNTFGKYKKEVSWITKNFKSQTHNYVQQDNLILSGRNQNGNNLQGSLKNYEG